MTGVLTNKWNWSSQAPMAGDQFSMTCLPKFWFRQFAKLWPLTLTCAIRQLLVTQKLSYNRKRDIWHYIVLRQCCDYDALTIWGFERFHDV